MRVLISRSLQAKVKEIIDMSVIYAYVDFTFCLGENKGDIDHITTGHLLQHMTTAVQYS